MLGNQPESVPSKKMMNPMYDNSLILHLGSVLKVFRVAANLTQADIAEKISRMDREPISQETISRIENGKQQISLEQLMAFGELFQKKPSEIIAWAEVHKQKSQDPSGKVLIELCTNVSEQFDREGLVAKRLALLDRLRRETLSKEPGFSWRVANIRRDYGCSDSVLRFVIGELEKEGLVRKICNERFDRSGYNHRFVLNLIQERFRLEAEVLKSLCNIKVDAQLLIDIQADMEACNTDDKLMRFVDGDIRFHQCIFEMAGAFAEGNQICELTRQIIYGLGTIVSSKRRDEILSEHKEIIAAIESGDADSARKSLKNHLLSGVKACEKESYRLLEEVFSDTNNAFEKVG